MNTKAGNVTRRDFLKTSAALAVVDFRHGWFGSRVRVVSGDSWITVFYGDEPKFHVDERSYHGTPRVWKHVDGETLQFGIQGARHPGSTLHIDLRCELSQSAKGLISRINFAGLGLTFEGLASEWLGTGRLHTYLIAPIRFADSESLRTVFFPGKVSLAADGLLRFQGGAEFRSPTHDLQLHAWAADLHPTYFKRDSVEMLRRSTVTLIRGPESWDLGMPRGEWEIVDEKAVFDSVEMAIEEHAHEGTFHTAVFRRSSLRPPAEMTIANGALPNPIALTDFRYSVSSADHLREVSANFLEPLVLRGEAAAVRLKNPTSQPALFATKVGPNPPRCKIIADATLELPDFEDVFLDAPDNWKVRLDAATIENGSDDAPPLADVDTRLRAANGEYLLEGALHLRIVRPLDGLDLALVITNVKIGLNGMLIQLSDHNKASLLVVDMPPQTLLEPAIPIQAPPVVTTYPPQVHLNIAASPHLRDFPSNSLTPTETNVSSLSRHCCVGEITVFTSHHS